MSWGFGVGTCPGAIDWDWVEKHKDKRLRVGGLIGSQPRKESEMLQITSEALIEACHLARNIDQCERAKDSTEEPSVRILGLICNVPLPREALVAAANAEIARCHEELKAMGISLIPSAPQKVGAVDELTGFAPGGYVGRPELGGIVGALVGGLVERP